MFQGLGNETSSGNERGCPCSTTSIHNSPEVKTPMGSDSLISQVHTMYDVDTSRIFDK